MLAMILETCREVGYQIELLARAVRFLPRALRRRRQISDQLFGAAVAVLHVVLLVGLFSGMILALQTGIELMRFGQQDQIGYVVALSIAREMGPFITGIVLAATVGSALAAELGTMSVSDELAALEILSIDRDDFLVMPRILSLALAGPLLTIVCDAIGIVGGGLVAQAQLSVEPRLYYDSAFDALQTSESFLSLPKDVYVGLFKSFVFGTIIATISCAVGVKTRGGAIGVGQSTRRAVRDSIIAIIIANYFLTWIFYQA